jgi:hypothetical protein
VLWKTYEREIKGSGKKETYIQAYRKKENNQSCKKISL